MKSVVTTTGAIELPLVTGEFSMIPFDLDSLKGLTGEFKNIAKQLLSGIDHIGGTAFLTVHGRKLKKGETLRRGGAHTDGNYEPVNMTFGGGSGGGNGWKVGENGPEIGHPTHARQYLNNSGGIILASNYKACNGWSGEFSGLPMRGGDCSHIELDDSFELEANKVYYGNNHFIHESLPMTGDVHRVFVRITMPEDHSYGGQ